MAYLIIINSKTLTLDKIIKITKHLVRIIIEEDYLEITIKTTMPLEIIIKLLVNKIIYLVNNNNSNQVKVDHYFVELELIIITKVALDSKMPLINKTNKEEVYQEDKITINNKEVYLVNNNKKIMPLEINK